MGEGGREMGGDDAWMVWGMILVLSPGYMYSEQPFAMMGENHSIFQIEQELVASELLDA
jgi:hypothetical protein